MNAIADFLKAEDVWNDAQAQYQSRLDPGAGPAPEWLALVATIRPALAAGLPIERFSSGSLLAAGIKHWADASGRPTLIEPKPYTDADCAAYGRGMAAFFRNCEPKRRHFASLNAAIADRERREWLAAEEAERVARRKARGY